MLVWVGGLEVSIRFVAKLLQEFSFITHDRPMVSPNMQKRNQLRLQNPKSICHSAPMLSKKVQNVKTSLPMSFPKNTGHGTLGTNWKVIRRLRQSMARAQPTRRSKPSEP